jgi:hypothetical protein
VRHHDFSAHFNFLGWLPLELLVFSEKPEKHRDKKPNRKGPVEKIFLLPLYRYMV